MVLSKVVEVKVTIDKTKKIIKNRAQIRLVAICSFVPVVIFVL
jgi:hypothetical protein